MQQYIDDELDAYWGCLADEERQLYEEGRYQELSECLMDRAENEYWQAYAFVLLTEWVPIVYVPLGWIAFEFGPWLLIGGLVALFLVVGLPPALNLVRKHRMYKSAGRIWAAVREDDQIGEELGFRELGNYMDRKARRLFAEGQTRELLDRMKEKGAKRARFSRIFTGVALSVALVFFAGLWIWLEIVSLVLIAGVMLLLYIGISQARYFARMKETAEQVQARME